MPHTTPHRFQGRWITTREFCDLSPLDLFHRQLSDAPTADPALQNRHILFRKRFVCPTVPEQATLYLSADDHYILLLNGRRIAEGPAPSYHFAYCYNEIDLTPYLVQGENVLAIHTLYQGLINRVWQSGDRRHGLILDLEMDGALVLSSDESFLAALHTGYRAIGTVGYATGFLEEYDSRSPEVGFEAPEFDDSRWENACLSRVADHTLVPQTTALTVSERIEPVKSHTEGNRVILDFGSTYAGYLRLSALGKSGDTVLIRQGQELNADGSVRYRLRANCTYQEPWILSDGLSRLEQIDYKSFRYVELHLPDGCMIQEVCLEARHYPFTLAASLKADYARDPRLQEIWKLCLHTQKYGVQEAVLDCMEREKGFYLGDGCYTALTHMVLSGDDCMVRKLIDDAFLTARITDGLMTCLNCSFMQEIAEYPLMLVKLILWHYRYTGDIRYLKKNYPRVVSLLDTYRRDYETNGLLSNLDKWCVVEWPANFRDGYDVDIREGKVCTQTHIAINAYYLEAIRTANRMAELLSLPPYREIAPLQEAFWTAFYLPEEHLFKDGLHTDHISLIGNLFPYAFGLCPDAASKERIYDLLCRRGISAVSLFGAFPLLEGLVRHQKAQELPRFLSDEGAWLRMLDEGATTTFESWGKDTKWNTSLFHLTFSYAALFLADIDLSALLG